MKNSVKIKAVCLFIIIIFIPGVLFAQPAGAPGGGGQNLKERMIKELDLNEEQQEALENFRDDREQVHKLMLKIQLERIELNELLKAEDFSEDKIKAQLEKLNQAMIDLNNQRIDNLLTLRKSLTQKQFKKLMSHVQQKMGRHSGGPGGSHHGPGGGSKGGKHQSFGPQRHGGIGPGGPEGPDGKPGDQGSGGFLFGLH
jgi:Spy/CpxP family protein refolding chaperone